MPLNKFLGRQFLEKQEVKSTVELHLTETQAGYFSTICKHVYVLVFPTVRWHCIGFCPLWSNLRLMKTPALSWDWWCYGAAVASRTTSRGGRSLGHMKSHAQIWNDREFREIMAMDGKVIGPRKGCLESHVWDLQTEKPLKCTQCTGRKAR